MSIPAPGSGTSYAARYASMLWLLLLAPGHMHNEPSWALRVPGAFTFLIGPREER